VNGFLTIALLALLAVLTNSPFVFPSLGPTAYLLFIAPLAENSSPRNSIVGHAIGLICGYAAFELTGAALMILFRAGHPPAGATTLIVSLGIISKPKELVIIEAAVVILVAQAFVINRLAGLSYPIWKKHETSQQKLTEG
jgi:CBS-domain-containing membrane protein